MNSRQYDPDELVALLLAAGDRQLDAAQLERLNWLVVNNEQAREAYFDHIFLIAEMRWLLDGPEPPPGDGPTVPDPAPQPTTSIWSVIPNLLANTLGQQVRPFAYPIVLVLFAAVFYGGFLLLVWNMHSLPQVAEQNDNGRVFDLERVATLTAQQSARWRSEKHPPALGDRLPMRQLDLLEGVVEITFAGGAVVRLEGPVRFETQDFSNLQLESGKLTAVVPPMGIGFTVLTPAVKVVDLGTEFGVLAKASGETEVEVFQGQVSLQPVMAEASPQPPLLLRAGQAKRISVQGRVEVAREATAETWRSLVDGLPKTEARPQVFPDSLVAYWSFDKLGRSVRDERGMLEGVNSGATPVPGLLNGRAMRFGNNGQRVRIPVHDGADALTTGMTIEAVVVSAWSGKIGDRDFIFRKQEDGVSTIGLALENIGSDQAERPVLGFEIATNMGVQTLHVPLDGRDGRPTRNQLANGKPHHVAATFNGASGEMAIFIDGARRGSRFLGKGVLLGNDRQYAQTVEKRDPSDSFNGVLDEVALYRAALSPREIAMHWNNVLRGSSYFEVP